MKIENMNKSLNVKMSGFKWFKIEGATVTMLEQPVVKRRNANHIYWHRGLLKGHSKFKFDGEGQVKIQTEEDLDQLAHVAKQYFHIIDTLEDHAWDVVDYADFSKLSTWDARPGYDTQYVKAFKEAIATKEAKNDLAKFDEDIVSLMINNIINENELTMRLYSKWFK